MIRGNGVSSNPVIGGARNNRQVVDNTASTVLSDLFNPEMEATFPGIAARLQQHMNVPKEARKTGIWAPPKFLGIMISLLSVM